MGQLKTSIIILAYKEPEKFKRMFETLIKNTSQKRTPYEIIVIDNDCDGNILKYLDTKRGDVEFLIHHNKTNGE